MSKSSPYRVAQGGGKVTSGLPMRVVVPRVTVKNRDPLVPYCVSSFTKPNRLVAFRSSERWTAGLKSKTTIRGIPFITRHGFISSNLVYYQKCSAAQWFATVTSTIFKRLQRWWHKLSKINSKVPRNFNDFLLRLSLYYVLTDRYSVLLRIFQCAIRNRKSARAFLYKVTSQMDENQRFLYGLALQSAKWLQLRGEPPRVKSIMLYRLSGLRQLPFTGNYFKRNRRLTTILHSLSDPWIRREEGLPIFVPSTASSRSRLKRRR